MGLCLSACSARDVANSDSSTTLEPDTSSSSEAIGINESIPSEPDGSPQAEQSAKLSETHDQNFVKIEVGAIEVGVDVDYVYGVFALDSNGNLFFGADNNSLEIVDTDVKDFYSSDNSFYILKENGDLMSSEDGLYKKDSPLVLFRHDDNAQKVSDSILMLSDGSLLSYQFENESWNLVDINASYVDADYFGAGIIDIDGILWYLNRETGELNQIAENVIDCSYTDRNKVYYSNDIWYITADNTMHLYQTEPQDDSSFTFPEDVDAISGEMGQYLAKKESGNIVSGNLWATANDTGMLGKDIDIFGAYYAILDENGEIHFGEIQSDHSLIETQLIVHP